MILYSALVPHVNAASASEPFVAKALNDLHGMPLVHIETMLVDWFTMRPWHASLLSMSVALSGGDMSGTQELSRSDTQPGPYGML
eukprot:353037-Chlamydomonas_euryale.AAC.13